MSGGNGPERGAAAPRVRRPLDAVSMMAALAATVLVIAMSGITSQTLAGVGGDLVGLGHAVPAFLGGPVSLLASIVSLLAAPGVFAALLVRGRGQVAAETLAAGLLAAGLSLAVATLLRLSGATDLELAFTPPPGGVPDTWPFLAFVTAVLAVPRFSERSRTARALRWSVGLLVLATLLDGSTTVSAVAVSLLLAWAAVAGTRLVAGVPGFPLDAAAVIGTLRRAGLEVDTVLPDRAVLDRLAVVESEHGFRSAGTGRAPAADTEPAIAESRYADPTAASRPGPPTRDYDVAVLTRDRVGTGLLYRAWRRLRLRGEVQPAIRFSLRRSVDRESLLAHAVGSAGVRSPSSSRCCRWPAPTTSSPRPTSSRAPTPSRWSPSTWRPARWPTSSRARSPTRCCATCGTRSPCCAAPRSRTGG